MTGDRKVSSLSSKRFEKRLRMKLKERKNRDYLHLSVNSMNPSLDLEDQHSSKEKIQNSKVTIHHCSAVLS
jgi:phage/plasmid-associated DNA primase